jgi:hypothetical protein
MIPFNYFHWGKQLFALPNRGDFSKLIYIFLVEIMCQHFEIYFLNPCRFVNLLIPFVTHPERFFLI